MHARVSRHNRHTRCKSHKQLVLTVEMIDNKRAGKAACSAVELVGSCRSTSGKEQWPSACYDQQWQALANPGQQSAMSSIVSSNHRYPPSAMLVAVVSSDQYRCADTGMSTVDTAWPVASNIMQVVWVWVRTCGHGRGQRSWPQSRQRAANSEWRVKPRRCSRRAPERKNDQGGEQDLQADTRTHALH
jgi:hypothetical protein